MKQINLLSLIVLIVLFSSCANQSGNDENNVPKPDSTETVTQGPDYSDLCVEYDGVSFKMLYPKQLANVSSFDFNNVTAQQQKEFLNVLENKSVDDARVFMMDNNLDIAERIEAIDSLYGNTGELRVAFSKKSNALDVEKDAIANKAEKEGEHIVGMGSTMQSLKDNYAYVRSEKDNMIYLRFVRISENGPCVRGELLYSADEETDYMKLEEYIIKSITFK